MNKTIIVKILSIFLLLVMLVPMISACPESPMLRIRPIPDMEVEVGENIEVFVVAAIKKPGRNGDMEQTRFGPPKIMIKGINMPENSTLKPVVRGMFLSVSKFTFTPDEPGMHRVVFVARTRMFGGLRDIEVLVINVLPEEVEEPEEPEPTPTPEPEPPAGDVTIIGTSEVTPIYPSGMWMHGRWHVEDLVMELYGLSEEEVDEILTRDLLKLLMKAKIDIKLGKELML